ncbi:MAG: hypothetical protein ABI718_11950 [Acidobacteriota bacterium]
MNTNILMASSALFMGVMGLAGTFLPQEVLRAAGLPSAGLHTVFIQILAALLLAFAITNWTAKDSLIGGIYNRPVALGNMMHFVVGAITLGKDVVSGERAVWLLVITTLYVAFAAGFIVIVFGSPVKPASET